MAEAARIFVSHAHEDNAWCQPFVEALRQAGANVWYDERDLVQGVLQREIEQQLRARPIFLLILSPQSVSSDWVQAEMTAAIHLKGQNPERIILPVMARRTEVPLLWVGYKRISGPGDKGINASEAAMLVIRSLGIGHSDPPPDGTETAEQATERGKSLRSQKCYPEALAAFERALRLDPQYVDAWKGKGLALRDLQRNIEALSAAEHAMTLDPRYAPAWYCKGVILWDLKRYSEQLSAAEHAITLDPQYSLSWNCKGLALEGLGQFDEALAAYEKALRLDPLNKYALNNKGKMLQGRGRALEALPCYEQALAVDPTYEITWHNMSLALSDLGRNKEALAQPPCTKSSGTGCAS
ncbi:MAG: tetratricopeptide repeat protein, partial [Ktedonobacterales bacterium]